MGFFRKSDRKQVSTNQPPAIFSTGKDLPLSFPKYLHALPVSRFPQLSDSKAKIQVFANRSDQQNWLGKQLVGCFRLHNVEDVDTFTKLVNAGAPVDGLEGGYYMTTGQEVRALPLLVALANGRLDIAELLLKSGADINAYNEVIDPVSGIVFLLSTADLILGNDLMQNDIYRELRNTGDAKGHLNPLVASERRWLGEHKVNWRNPGWAIKRDMTGYDEEFMLNIPQNGVHKLSIFGTRPEIWCSCGEHPLNETHLYLE